MDRERCLLDLCTYVRGAAEMVKVGREAIAYIQACGGQFAADQGLTDVETRLRGQLRMVLGGCHREDAPVPLQHHCQLRCCAAELSGYVQGIAGDGTGTAKGFAFWGGTDENDVCEDETVVPVGRFRGITSCKGYAVHLGQGAQSAEEALDRVAACGGRQH